MDKGYDYDDVRHTVAECGYVPQILARGEERKKQRKSPRYRARRWVCERTHSWLNRFRRILVRWEKKVANYEAMLHFACAYICYSAAAVLGYALRQRLTEAAMVHSPTGVFNRAEVAAWLSGSADAEAALVKRALAAGEVIRICRGL